MSVKVGIGYDVHRLAEGRKLVLGGVEIPHTHGLEGHSDADVLLHALCDALLGAIGRGDIGEHFPNKDPQYKNISSLVLLERVYALVKKEGYSIGNADVMVLAEAPQLKDYKVRMRTNIAQKLALAESDINIKATTAEGLGFIGSREGIAAYAVVSLSK